MSTTNLMKGKRGVIMGVANERSLAWGIAQALHGAGADLAFSYAGENLERRVRPLAEKVGSSLVFPCDVGSDEAVTAFFNHIKQAWGTIDFLVHAIAFADKNELRNRFVDTSRDNFRQSLDISAYSLVATSRAAEPLMERGGSIITLTYRGSEKVIPNYNVMGVAKAALEASTRYLAADLGPRGIRVNAISPGPVKTLAASAIGGFSKMLEDEAAAAPLRRNITGTDVGGTALWLLSDLGTGTTGETIHVDGGSHCLG